MECGDYPRVALRTARDKDAPDEFMHLVLAKLPRPVTE